MPPKPKEKEKEEPTKAKPIPDKNISTIHYETTEDTTLRAQGTEKEKLSINIESNPLLMRMKTPIFGGPSTDSHLEAKDPIPHNVKIIDELSPHNDSFSSKNIATPQEDCKHDRKSSKKLISKVSNSTMKCNKQIIVEVIRVPSLSGDIRRRITNRSPPHTRNSNQFQVNGSNTSQYRSMSRNCYQTSTALNRFSRRDLDTSVYIVIRNTSTSLIREKTPEGNTKINQYILLKTLGRYYIYQWPICKSKALPRYEYALKQGHENYEQEKNEEEVPRN